jgi:hypothetical protein
MARHSLEICQSTSEGSQETCEKDAEDERVGKVKGSEVPSIVGQSEACEIRLLQIDTSRN